MITKKIKLLARGLGFDISRYRPDTHHDARYRHLLDTRDIRLILDVGANTGQYGSLLRSTYGYRGRILSFEPLTTAHTALRTRASGWLRQLQSASSEWLVRACLRTSAALILTP